MNAVEIWVKINKFDYSVSSFGRVRNDRTNRILKLIYTNGYHYVHLHRDGLRYDRAVHYLVCVAFHGKRPKGKTNSGLPSYTPNHKDNDTFNNREENLEWFTKSEQLKQAIENGRPSYLRSRGTENIHSKLSEEDIIEIRKLYSGYKKPTLAKIAERYNVSLVTIHHIITRKTWSHI